MVILFSSRKSKNESEITEILKKYGASFISDRTVSETSGKFTVVCVYKKTEISLNKGIGVFIEKTNRFKDQQLPIGIVGICEENNCEAFKIFKINNNAVITCGINSKNTVTFSSIGNNALLITLQRTIFDINGNPLYPCELNIKLTKQFSSLSVMVSAVILLLNGILPQEF